MKKKEKIYQIKENRKKRKRMMTKQRTKETKNGKKE